MEFSWQYSATMRNLATSGNIVPADGTIHTDKEYPIMLVFEWDANRKEVPVIATTQMSMLNEPTTVVIPLYTVKDRTQCAGAETMLKRFARTGRNVRLLQETTPKGEVYYGNFGMILDKDFNPLFYTTVELTRDSNSGQSTRGPYTVHFHPKVFLEDGIINKSLLKKGIAYYLQASGDGAWHEKYKVTIDDGSDYFKKAVKPNISEFSTSAVTELLKKNIGELLSQITYDSRHLE